MNTNSKTQFSTRFAISYSRVLTKIQSGKNKTGLARQDDGFRNFLDQYPNYKAWEQKFEDIGKSAFQTYKNRSTLTAIIDLDRKGKGQINIPTIEPKICIIRLKTYN